MSEAETPHLPSFEIPREFSCEFPWERLALPLMAAEDALARLDERLRASPIKQGWIARMHFIDACASSWLEGELVHLEDLVLHDAGMNARRPTPEIIHAYHVLSVRRIIAQQSPERALESIDFALEERWSAAAVSEQADTRFLQDASNVAESALDEALRAVDLALARTGRALAEPDEAQEGAERHSRPEQSGDDIARSWREGLQRHAHLPPLLAAGLVWDDCEAQLGESATLRRDLWPGRLLAGAFLMRRGKARAHLPCINLGLRAVPWERRRSTDATVRLLAWLDAALAGADAGLKECDRLLLMRDVHLAKCAGRRATSRLPELIALALESPYITTGMVTQRLGVSLRAALNLIRELGLREATGRGRFRAWML